MTATASTSFFSEPPSNAFDGSTTTYWTTNGVSTGWIQNQLGSPLTAVQYSIARRDDIPTRNPTAWTFLGSNDGSTWTTLDTQSGITWPTAGETQVFTFANSTAFSYYRLDITANGGDGYLSVAELTIAAASPDATVRPPAATASASAVAPVISASSTVAPPVATASAQAPAPVIDTATNATIAPPAATATASAPAPVITQIIPAGTDTSNFLNGRNRRARASVTVTRPVASPPSNLATKHDKAVPLPPPTLVDGRVT